MLSFTGSLRAFVALEACDMRKEFDGLSGMVATKLKEDLQSGGSFCSPIAATRGSKSFTGTARACG
jgi:hypothetical protein